jgi:hypothetical protein
MPERKSISERLERSLALAREAGFPNDRASLDEKSFMDKMWDEPSGDFSLTDVECIDLGKDPAHRGADNSRHSY